MKILLILTGLAVFLTSCSSGNQEQSSNENNQESSSKKANDSLQYTYKNFYIESSKALEGDDTTYFRAVYPEFSVPKINEYVQKNIILNDEQSSIENVGKQFIKDYDEFYEEVEFKRPWFEERMDSVKVQTHAYIGFVSHFSTYTGGAHGNYGTTFNNYNVLENKAYTIDDFISDYSSLTEIAEKVFRENEQISAEHTLTDEYFFENGIFSLPDNYILQKKGILFFYNIYEIKPYSSGHTELIIPYKHINFLLTPQAKEIIEEIEK